MRKKNMRTPEEKAKIIEEYLNGEHGLHYYERKYNIHYQVLHRWYNKYLEDGIDGLKSKTGKKKDSYNRNQISQVDTKFDTINLGG